MQGNQGMQRRELMQWFVRCLVGRGKLVSVWKCWGCTVHLGISSFLVLRQEFWGLEGLNGQSPKMTLINRLDILCIYIYVRVCVCVSALKTFGPTTKHLQVLFPLANWFLPETTLEQPLHTSMAQVDPFCCPLIVLGFHVKTSVQPGWWELSLHSSAATMGPAGCETQGEREAFGWSVVLWSKLSTELRKKWIMCFFLGFS